MHTSQELLDPRKDSQADIEHTGLSHQGLLSSSLDDIKQLKTGAVSEHFADVSRFTFADSSTNRSERAAESQGNDLDVTVPKGSDVVIGGSNCHIDLKISPIGQILITTKPGANCDVHLDRASKDLASPSEMTFSDPFGQNADASPEKEPTREKIEVRSSTKDAGDYDPLSADALKSADLPQTAIDKMTGSAEYRDAEEFHKKFGNNPNSPEAIAWIEQKIQQQATKEAKEAEEKAERSGLAPVGDAGYFYAQALLLHIAARHPNFNANNVHGSYFSHESGWRGMQGFFTAR